MKKQINYMFIDVETSGLDPIKNDTLQIAAVPIVGGIKQPSFNQYAQPTDWSTIDANAMAVNKITNVFLLGCQSAHQMIDNLVKYAKTFNTKFIIAGYNAGFDKDFIASTFKKVGREKEFYDIFTQDVRDTLKRAKALKTQLPIPNLKLGTLCEHFNIPIQNAHDAIHDILATIEVDKKLSSMLGEIDLYEIETAPLLPCLFPEPAQLHLHSMYSHTDSIVSIKEWVEYCLKNNIKGFSCVDHGSAASLFEMKQIPSLIKKINEERIKDKEQPYTTTTTGIPGVGLIVEINKNRFHLNAWAVSNSGYKNLIKLASIGWKNKFSDSDSEFPLLKEDQILQYKDGIIFGVPGINGPITKYLLSRQQTEAHSIIEWLNSNLNIRLELASVDAYKYFDSTIGFRVYNIEGANIQKHINNFYYNIANKLNIKLVPVSDAHLLREEDKILHDCICKNSFKDSRYFFESRHISNAQQMYSILKNHVPSISEEEFSNYIKNTHEIADLASKIDIKYSHHLPAVNIPDIIKSSTDDYNMQTYYYTMQKIKEHGRWNDSPEYVDRFKKEIDVIMKNQTLNFLPYFLMYEDICGFTRSEDLPTGIARGSAGGSLLSYYLKIIHIDPIVSNLPFERFLSHARIRAGSFPDIDLDIAKKARPLVVKYLQEKYGLGFAQMATFSTMKTKNAIKDAMAALYGRNRNDPEVKALCEEISDSPQGVDEYDFLYGYTDQEGEIHKGEIEKKPAVALFFRKYPEVEEMVKRMIGMIRGWSRHASAFVISTIDLASDRVPTMIMSDKNLGEIVVTQYDASMVEKSGLVKADILGIKTLNMVADCVKLIKKNHHIDYMEEDKGVPLIYRLPDADKGVFSDFYKKDTDSSFQFNTELIKGYAQEFAPLNRSDLSVLTALCRPGSLDAPLYDTTATQYYLDARNSKRTVEYLHHDLEPILKDTYGVIAYQEQLLKILVDIVGYSWEESDIIRSAIAKKKHEVIMSTFTKIREVCIKRGWSNEAVETFCQQVQAFSNYSFNLSHSAAYAELGYITLYLKHHYPLEWWCSVLNNEDDEDNIRKFISYLSDKVAPPSLKNPALEYSIANNKIITPISAIKSIGPAVAKEIVSKGPFLSIEDYVNRINHSKVNIASMACLVKARAADDFMEGYPNFSNYIETRRQFLQHYMFLRQKNKTTFKPELLNADAIQIFLDEKEYNLSFNKTILNDSILKANILKKWPGLKPTSIKNIPFFLGKDDESQVAILDSVHTAEKLLAKKSNKEVGFFMLYEGSSHKSGISKKTGKEWNLVSIMLNDGYCMLEAKQWKAKKALGWKKDTIVYVSGFLEEGWSTSVSLNIKEITKVE